MRPSAADWIEKLQLVSHLEGGAFREIYRSKILLPVANMPPGFKGDRNLSTAIYFLLQQHQFSAFHRIRSDEQWHFYYGDDLVIYELEENGRMIEHRLGNQPATGGAFTCVVQAGNWFAARLQPGGDYALAGCTVGPGFDYSEFELADRQALTAQFPQHTEIITQLTT